MGCGCAERRVFAHKAIDAMKRGDRVAVRENLTAMNLSVRQDLHRVAKVIPKPNFKLKPEVAKAYGLTSRG